jgi:hypothetical protein
VATLLLGRTTPISNTPSTAVARPSGCRVENHLDACRRERMKNSEKYILQPGRKSIATRCVGSLKRPEFRPLNATFTEADFKMPKQPKKLSSPPSHRKLFFFNMISLGVRIRNRTGRKANA